MGHFSGRTLFLAVSGHSPITNLYLCTLNFGPFSTKLGGTIRAIKNLGFGPKNSDFCHTNPILVNGPFVALGETVHFPRWERFFVPELWPFS